MNLLECNNNKNSREITQAYVCTMQYSVCRLDTTNRM
jgi:hypothetical protein